MSQRLGECTKKLEELEEQLENKEASSTGKRNFLFLLFLRIIHCVCSSGTDT